VNKIRERRKQLVMTQAELALVAGVTKPTLRAMETGEFNGFHPKTLRCVAYALGWTPEELYKNLMEVKIGK
jgi:DNA-binding XRE family transcriptional regulator